MEPDCSVSAAYCNGSSSASNGVLSDSQSVLSKLVDESSSTSKVAGVDDVYAQLGKKDNDLQLAAELGNVLLQQNEELRWTNEQMSQEFNQKIEVLLPNFFAVS